jgi:hypothetical protein
MDIQPDIVFDEWGLMLIQWDIGVLQCKDTVLGPGMAIDWDWNWDREDRMHHAPGMREKDLDKFLQYEQLQNAYVILSTGRNQNLMVNPNLKKYLKKKKGIKKVYILETSGAILKYKKPLMQGKRVAAFIHTTC